MKYKSLKKYFFDAGVNLESKSCKILMIMYGISDEEGNINTSLSDLQLKSGMSINTIRSAIKELEEKQILYTNYKIGIDTEYKLYFYSEFN